MRKIASIVLVFVLALSFVGCTYLGAAAGKTAGGYLKAEKQKKKICSVLSEDGTYYTNDFTGITIYLPDGWGDINNGEIGGWIEKLTSAAQLVSSGTVTNDIMLVKDDTSEMFSVNYYDLDGEITTGEEYAEAFVLKQTVEGKVADIVDEGDFEVSGHEFYYGIIERNSGEYGTDKAKYCLLMSTVAGEYAVEMLYVSKDPIKLNDGLEFLGIKKNIQLTKGYIIDEGEYHFNPSSGVILKKLKGWVFLPDELIAQMYDIDVSELNGLDGDGGMFDGSLMDAFMMDEERKKACYVTYFNFGDIDVHELEYLELVAESQGGENVRISESGKIEIDGTVVYYNKLASEENGINSVYCNLAVKIGNYMMLVVCSASDEIYFSEVEVVFDVIDTLKPPI